MADNTRIEWADVTFNPWWGCTRVSPACDHCYAATLAHRFGVGWGNDAERRIASEDYWFKPLRWNRRAKREGRKIRVFCGSMCDVFEDRRELDEHRKRLSELIERTPHLFWLLLTKRPQNIPKKRFSGLSNVGLGVTIESEAYLWRMEELLDISVEMRFASCEPMLGPLRIQRFLPQWRVIGGSTTAFMDQDRICDWRDPNRAEWSYLLGLDWVITGGESGPGARPSHPDWFRSLRDQCAAVGVPFFFKQWGEYASMGRGGAGWDSDEIPLRSDGFDCRGYEALIDDSTAIMCRVGKKAAGNLLDGRQHLEIPEVCR